MIKKIDHLVITTGYLGACLSFYESLGFKSRNADGRFELYVGDFKINIHLKGRELEPKAKKATPGSADFCLETDENLKELKERVSDYGYEPEVDIIPRHGAKGPMHSIYYRDPDGNLVELCHYDDVCEELALFGYEKWV